MLGSLGATMGGHTRQVFSKSSHSFVAPLLELAQTCYITYCIIHCVYIIEPGSTKYQFCSCLPQAWNFAPLWFVHRHPGFSATIFTTKHLFKVHTANTIDPFFAPWQGWEVPRETSKPQVKTSPVEAHSGVRKQEHSDSRQCSTTSEMPFQTGGFQGQGQPPRYLPHQHNCSSQDTLPLQLGAVASAATSHPQHAQLWISNKTLSYVVKKYTKFTARSKSYNYQIKGQRFFSEMLTILYSNSNS